jgi:thioredoxin-dependent peroxiredoxin
MEKAGVEVLGVSWRPVEFNKDLCDKEGINFALLSDPDRAVIKRYGVWNEKDNAARRVTFLIDPQGVIRDIDREVKPQDYGKTLVERAKRVLGKK